MAEPFTILGITGASSSALLKLIETTLHYAGISDDVRQLLHGLAAFDETIKQTKSLRRVKSHLMDERAKLDIDKTITRSEEALSNIAGTIEACRKDIQIDQRVRSKNRLMWLLKDESAFMARGWTVSACMQTLNNHITRMMLLQQQVQSPPTYESATRQVVLRPPNKRRAFSTSDDSQSVVGDRAVAETDWQGSETYVPHSGSERAWSRDNVSNSVDAKSIDGSHKAESVDMECKSGRKSPTPSQRGQKMSHEKDHDHFTTRHRKRSLVQAQPRSQEQPQLQPRSQLCDLTTQSPTNIYPAEDTKYIELPSNEPISKVQSIEQSPWLGPEVFSSKPTSQLPAILTIAKPSLDSDPTDLDPATSLFTPFQPFYEDPLHQNPEKSTTQPPYPLHNSMPFLTLDSDLRVSPTLIPAPMSVMSPSPLPSLTLSNKYTYNHITPLRRVLTSPDSSVSQVSSAYSDAAASRRGTYRQYYDHSGCPSDHTRQYPPSGSHSHPEIQSQTRTQLHQRQYQHQNQRQHQHQYQDPPHQQNHRRSSSIASFSFAPSVSSRCNSLQTTSHGPSPLSRHYQADISNSHNDSFSPEPLLSPQDSAQARPLASSTLMPLVSNTSASKSTSTNTNTNTNAHIPPFSSVGHGRGNVNQKCDNVSSSPVPDGIISPKPRRQKRSMFMV